jgi:response regulator RpfG family c-di-GMP phosphodiesterase
MDNRERTLDEFFRKNDPQAAKKAQKPETKKIDDYFETVAAAKAPKPKAFFDKLIDFFRLTSFKNRFDEKKVSLNQKQLAAEGKSRLSAWWNNVIHQFVNWFSFEAGVDILDETSVLYRKNLVIKNIIWITNVVFLLFTAISSEAVLTKTTNLIVLLVIFLIMFFTNRMTKKIIYEQPTTLQRQQLGEYISGVYILLMAVTVYIKTRITVGDTAVLGLFSITQAAYSLIYFALVVIALYQDPKLLKVIFNVTILAMTIIHVTVLYPVYTVASDIVAIWNYVKGPVLVDIGLRTLVLAVFMIALYSTAKITEDMNAKRKEELLKRRSMEKDFKAVVSDVFDVIAVYRRHSDLEQVQQEEKAVSRIAEIASRLGNYLGFSPKLCKEIFDFSTIHVDKKNLLSLSEYDEKEVLDESDFKQIREKTIIGSVIIKRLQLDQKGEDIVRAHFEKTANAEFVKEMNAIQNNRESQVILIAQLYEILRQDRNYKRGLKHSRAIDLIQLEFYPYFDPQILDRFVKYGDDFESLYYKLTQR